MPKGALEVIVFDVTAAQASKTALENLLQAGPIQIIINNAGIHDDAPMAGMSSTQWHRVIDVSLRLFQRNSTVAAGWHAPVGDVLSAYHLLRQF